MTRELTHAIDALLHERRPDRYTPRWNSRRADVDDDEAPEPDVTEIDDDEAPAWLREIADEVAGLIPEAQARQTLALTLVLRREGQMMRQTNRILRDCMTNPPLDWDFFASLPLAVGRERVALRACKAEDFRQFANEERARSASEFVIREATCKAAETIARKMDDQGIDVAKELRW